jgi:Raf kinase inhibitor-like YbhB/YbcL family protein
VSPRWLGHVLRGIRAGEKYLAWNEVATAPGAPATIDIASPAFATGAVIPPRFGGKGVGDNVSPALSWSGVPSEARELVLIVEDPDAPLPRPFVHAVVFAIPPGTPSIGEGGLSANPEAGIVLGKNTFGKTEYGGPRPIPGHGPHAYVFQIFALDRHLSFASLPSRRDIVRQMRGAVIGRGRLDGIFER